MGQSSSQPELSTLPNDQVDGAPSPYTPRQPLRVVLRKRQERREAQAEARERLSAQKLDARASGENPLEPLRKHKQLFGINPSTLPVSSSLGYFQEGREEGKIRRSK